MRALREILEMIKFEHTLFALPFALMSAVIAAHGLPSWSVLGWILLAMIGARSAAMTMNRIIDVAIDAKNPRTASRAIPAARISLAQAWVFSILMSALFIYAAYRLNTLAFMLSPVALIWVFGYSYTKRFTSFCHLWLGLGLAIAPMGAWIAVRGQFDLLPMVLAAAVSLWTAGFDVFYSLQDIAFDREQHLNSIPVRFGISRALQINKGMHIVMLLLMVWVGLLGSLGTLYWLGVAIITVLMAIVHRQVKPDDLSRVNAAFFTINGWVGVMALAFTGFDVWLHR